MPVDSIAIIIPTRGDRDLTELTAAIHRQTRRASEIFVVEDRSLRGSAWARNRGIELSSAELLVFLDDDCIPPPGWLEALAATVDNYGAAGAGGTYDEEDPFLRARRRRQNYPDAVLIDEAGWVGAGGNVAYLRAVLEQLRARDGHYFNEAFRISEDKELAWRVRMRGGKLVFIPVPVRHTKHCTGRKVYRRAIRSRDRYCGSFLDRWREPRSVAPDRGMLWRTAEPDSRLVKDSFSRSDRTVRRAGFQSDDRLPGFSDRKKSQGLGFSGGSCGGHLCVV